MQRISTKFGSVMTAALLMIGGLAFAVTPTASAHYCKSYSEKCDPDGCVEGEDHHHIRMHYFTQPEECKTTKEPEEPKPGRCDGKPLVEKLICILIGDEAGQVDSVRAAAA